MILEILLMSLMFLETKIYKKIVTPLNVFLGPIVVSLILLNIMEPSMSNMVLKVHLLFISAIWIILGFIIKKFFNNYQTNENINIFSNENVKKLGIVIVSLTAINIAFHINKLGITNLKGRTGGLLEHLFILSSVFLSIELIRKKGTIYKILYFVILILLSIKGGKYQLFLFILPSVLLSIYEEKTLSLKFLKKITLIVSSIFLTFGIVYYLNFSLKGASVNILEFFKFVVNHVKYYFLCSMYIGNELIELPKQGNFNYAFAPFLNIYQCFLGDKIYIIPLLKFRTVLGIHSNVGGLIPELVYSIGNIGMYLYVGFIGMISYILDNLASKNKIWIYSDLIFKSSLILCFFNNVFTVLGYIERIIGTIVITIVIIIIQKIKKENNL